MVYWPKYIGASAVLAPNNEVSGVVGVEAGSQGSPFGLSFFYSFKGSNVGARYVQNYLSLLVKCRYFLRVLTHTNALEEVAKNFHYH